MDGKEAIIKRIIDDAKLKANAVIDEAKKTAEERKQDAEAWAEDYVKAQEEILSKDEKDIISRRLTVADLEVRKIILKAKQDKISEVLNKAYASLCALKKPEYLKLIGKLIEENADEGDEIVLSSDGVVSCDDIKKLDIFGNKKLTISKKVGEFKGGVMLIGKVCDKDLTFKALIDNDKEGLIAEVSKELFGE